MKKILINKLYLFATIIFMCCALSLCQLNIYAADLHEMDAESAPNDTVWDQQSIPLVLQDISQDELPYVYYGEGDSIDATTGSVYRIFNDIEIPGYEPQLYIGRIYSSNSGMRYNYSCSVKRAEGSRVLYNAYLPNGMVVTLKKKTDITSIYAYNYNGCVVKWQDENNDAKGSIVIQTADFTYVYGNEASDTSQSFPLTKIIDRTGKQFLINNTGFTDFKGNHYTRMSDSEGIRIIQDATKKSLMYKSETVKYSFGDKSEYELVYTVTDFNNNTKRYYLNKLDQIIRIEDENHNTVEQFKYNTSIGEQGYKKLQLYIDGAGNEYRYGYTYEYIRNGKKN